MLHQSLPVNYILSTAGDLAAGLREISGKNLLGVEISPATVIYDLLHSLGLPERTIATVLNPAEMAELGGSDPADPLAIHCQRCGDDADRLINYRGNRLLVCTDCADKLNS